MLLNNTAEQKHNKTFQWRVWVPCFAKQKRKSVSLQKIIWNYRRKRKKKYPKNKESLQTWWRNPQANGCVIQAEEQSRDESGKLKQQWHKLSWIWRGKWGSKEPQRNYSQRYTLHIKFSKIKSWQILTAPNKEQPGKRMKWDSQQAPWLKVTGWEEEDWVWNNSYSGKHS